MTVLAVVNSFAGEIAPVGATPSKALRTCALPILSNSDYRNCQFALPTTLKSIKFSWLITAKNDDFSNADLSNLPISRFIHCILVNTKLPQVEEDAIIQLKLDGPFDYLDFTNSEIGGNTLEGGGGKHVNLTGASLINAHLENSSFVNIVGLPRDLPKNWKLIHSMLVGPYVSLVGRDLQNIDFKNYNLNHAVFDFAKVKGAKFGRANLTGAVGCHITGRPATLPFSFSISRGILFSGQLKASISKPKPNDFIFGPGC